MDVIGSFLQSVVALIESSDPQVKLVANLGLLIYSELKNSRAIAENQAQELKEIKQEIGKLRKQFFAAESAIIIEGKEDLRGTAPKSTTRPSHSKSGFKYLLTKKNPKPVQRKETFPSRKPAVKKRKLSEESRRFMEGKMPASSLGPPGSGSIFLSMVESLKHKQATGNSFQARSQSVENRSASGSTPFVHHKNERRTSFEQNIAKTTSPINPTHSKDNDVDQVRQHYLSQKNLDKQLSSNSKNHPETEQGKISKQILNLPSATPSASHYNSPHLFLKPTNAKSETKPTSSSSVMPPNREYLNLDRNVQFLCQIPKTAFTKASKNNGDSKTNQDHPGKASERAHQKDEKPADKSFLCILCDQSYKQFKGGIVKHLIEMHRLTLQQTNADQQLRKYIKFLY